MKKRRHNTSLAELKLGKAESLVKMQIVNSETSNIGRIYG